MFAHGFAAALFSHVEEVLSAEATAILGCQLSPQCRDNLVDVFGPFFLEAVTDLLVQQHKLRIHRLRSANC